MFYNSAQIGRANSGNGRAEGSRNASKTPQISQSLTAKNVGASSNMTYYRSDETPKSSFSTNVPSKPSLFVGGIKQALPKASVNTQIKRSLNTTEKRNNRISSASSSNSTIMNRNEKMSDNLDFVKPIIEKQGAVNRPSGPFHDLF